MGKQHYLVVEVLDPKGPKPTRNVWVNLDADVSAIENGFRSLKADGHIPTGTVSRAVVENGEVVERVAAFPGKRLFDQGWRTMSAFLRA